MTWDRDRWGAGEPPWQGDSLVDLHDGRGTEWKRWRDGSLYPNCDCHRPKIITRELAGAKVAVPPTSTRKTRPEAATRRVSAPADDPGEIDDETAVRMLAVWLKRLATRTPKGEK